MQDSYPTGFGDGKPFAWPCGARKTAGAASLCTITVLPSQVIQAEDVPLYTV
jgi:hypothetical protein